ncbi:MAG TPA: TIGR03435 family protein [Bryobacteraceae bacterium]
MKFHVGILSLAVGGVAAFGQVPSPEAGKAPLSFEVASVRAAGTKPPYTPIAASGVITGGPGSADPTRVTYTWMLMRVLLMNAFGVPFDQISGNDWVMGQDTRFDITANVPAGATKEQADEMLLNLLTERFHMKYHREKKDFDMWTLVVAKGGAKLKDAELPNGPPPEAPKPGTPAQMAPLDRDGFPQLPAGRTNMMGRSTNGVMRLSFRMSTPQSLLNLLQFTLGGRSMDKTGLTGKYDFTLEFAQSGLARGSTGPDASDAAPDLFSALEKQLGLKLEKSKVPLDVIVIDHMDKEPTEN